MASEDIPGRLVDSDQPVTDIFDFKRQKLQKDIERQREHNQKVKAGLLGITHTEVHDLRIEEMENRMNKLMEYTQDLYFTTKAMEEDLALQRSRINFLIGALKKLAIWTEYEGE